MATASRSFVEACKRERDALLALFTDVSGTSAVAHQLLAAGLSGEQHAHVIKAFDIALTDTFYTILLGLGGAASIGGVQRSYRLLDEAGGLVSEDGDGDLEAHAYEVFKRNS